jgi:hypothetical protein
MQRKAGARKPNQNGKSLKANCKGKKQEKEANKETQSATNEKRERGLEWANQRQANVQVWQGQLSRQKPRPSRVAMAEITPFTRSSFQGIDKVFDKQGYSLRAKVNPFSHFVRFRASTLISSLHSLRSFQGT